MRESSPSSSSPRLQREACPPTYPFFGPGIVNVNNDKLHKNELQNYDDLVVEIVFICPIYDLRDIELDGH